MSLCHSVLLIIRQFDIRIPCILSPKGSKTFGSVRNKIISNSRYFMSLTRRTENPFERKFSVRERKPLPNI